MPIVKSDLFRVNSSYAGQNYLPALVVGMRMRHKIYKATDNGDSTDGNSSRMPTATSTQDNGEFCAGAHTKQLVLASY